MLKNDTLWGGTYLYGLYMGVPPPPPPGIKARVSLTTALSKEKDVRQLDISTETFGELPLHSVDLSSAHTSIVARAVSLHVFFFSSYGSQITLGLQRHGSSGSSASTMPHETKRECRLSLSLLIAKSSTVTVTGLTAETERVAPFQSQE